VYALVFVLYNGGDFYYKNKNGKEKESSSFWSYLGSIVLIVFYFLRDGLTLITNIVLNIVSLYEMNKYFNQKRSLLRPQKLAIVESQLASNNNNNAMTAQNKRNKAAEKNHLKLVLTICFISIIIRVSCVACDVYYLFSTDHIAILLGTLSDLTLVLGPSVSFFVFYYFNRDFRLSFLNIVFRNTVYTRN